jgi:hypothetical protein
VVWFHNHNEGAEFRFFRWNREKMSISLP